MGTFSAQFPPPEMVEHYNAIYAPIRKPSQPSKSNNTPMAEVTSPKTQVRHGPSGNFVIYERSGMPIYGQINDSNQAQPQPLYGQITHPSNSTPASKMPSTTASPIYGQNPLKYQYPNHDNTYSNPPPPLPYRPPPPNPYTQHHPSSPLLNQRQQHAASPLLNQRPRQSSPHMAGLIKRNEGNSIPNSPHMSTANYVRRNETRIPDRSIYAMSEPSSSNSPSSSSGPSSIDSQTLISQRIQTPEKTVRPLFDDTLVVIEKSNQELELKLNKTSAENPKPKPRVPLTRPRIDTIHNNRNLSQEVIYEVESSPPSSAEHSRLSATEKTPQTSSTDLSRSSSQSTIKPESGQESVAPSFPSISDLTLNDVGTSFKSLTAQKLMAGLSFNSIDTLLEVNAAAEARNHLDETTETIDFGVI